MKNLMSRFYGDFWMLSAEDSLFEYVIVTVLSLMIAFTVSMFVFLLVLLLAESPGVVAIIAAVGAFVIGASIIGRRIMQ